MLLAGGAGGVVNLWRVESGRRIAQVKASFNGVVAVAPDEARLAICDTQEVNRIFTLPEMIEERSFPGDYSESLAFVSNDKLLAGNCETVKVFDIFSGEVVMEISDARDAAVAVVSPDYSKVLTGAVSGNIDVWDANGRYIRSIEEAHDDKVMCISFSRSGELLSSASIDGVVKLWDAATYKLIRRKSISPKVIFEVAFSSDDRLFALACDGGIRVWEAGSWNEIDVGSVAGEGTAVSFSTAGDVLVGGGISGQVRLWRYPVTA